MTTLAQKLMTAEEFAVWAEARPEKHWELFGGVPQLQPAQNVGHARLTCKIARLIEDAILAAGLRLLVGTRGLVVKAGPGLAFEPDVVVSEPMAGHEIIVREPVIAIEVLSPSTERKDLTVKLAGYFNVPSIEHYVLADWETAELIHFRRAGSGFATPVMLREGELRLAPPGIGIALAKVFQ
jgi:Uma2 family endonuclease